MPRDTRKAIIEKIEILRGSKVLTYVTGDRPPAAAQIGDDAVRPLYHHLRQMGHVDSLDLFIYSRGGAIDIPWRINTAFRTTAGKWSALVPFRANSAATLLCLGADEIVLGRNGELGPIDPIMTIQRLIARPDSSGGTVVQDAVSVEDIMAYVKFIQERAGLSDQAALATGLSKLTERLDAVALGSIYRTHSHIRDVARRMLLSRNSPGSEQAMTAIVETLAERVYAHGHAIGLRTATEIGLSAVGASPELDGLMWELFEEYEKDLKLQDPLDIASAVANADKYTEDATIAIVESAAAVHEFSGRIEITAKRHVPPTLNVSVNLNIPLPPALAGVLQGGAGGQAAALQQVLQQFLQQAQQAALQQAQQAVQDALAKQAPIAGVDAAFRGGRWRLV